MKLINTAILIMLAALVALVIYTYTAKPALAATDWQCMNQCTMQGYMYGYCLKVCGY